CVRVSPPHSGQPANPMHKQFITAQQLLDDAQELALRVIESGYRPDLIAGVWRGGAGVAGAGDGVFDFAGLACEHCPISARSYTGVGRHGEVEVSGLELLKDKLGAGRKVLIVDDVFDTGRSLYRLMRELHALTAGQPPQVKLAVPWFKPARNETPIEPDWYLHTPDDWLVFPHELADLSDGDLRHGKSGPLPLRERLLALRRERLEVSAG